MAAVLCAAACAASAAPTYKYSFNTATVREGVDDAMIAAIKQDAPKAKGRLTLSVQKISNADLAKLLEAVPEVKTLVIYSCGSLSDLAPLAKLKDLKGLTVSSTIVSDFSPLASLSGLETISVSSDQMTSVAWMKNLTNLRSLSVSAKALTSWEGLPSLPSLKSAKLASAPAPLDPIVAALPNVEKLDLAYADVKDLTPLTKLEKLKDLSLYGAQVKDFSPLAGCKALKTFMYYAVKGADFSTLSKLTQVEVFKGGLTQMNSFDWIKGLQNVRVADTFAEYVTDYSPLAESSVQEFQIWSMRVPVDLTSLGKAKTLKKLTLWSVDKGTNSKALAGLTNLETFTIRSDYNKKGGEPFDLSAAAAWTSLKTIDLSGCTVANAASLAKCTSLERAIFVKVNGLDLAALKALPKLKYLTLPKGAFKPEELKSLPASVKVYER